MRDLVGAPADDAPAVRTQADERAAWVPGMRPPPRHGGGSDSETERWRDRLRWDPGRRGLVALALAVVVVLAATGWWLAAGRPKAMPITASGPGPTASIDATESKPESSAAMVSAAPPVTAASSVAVASASAGVVVVDVAGKVRRPGVYTLPPGARVYEALRAAGGVRHGASTLSLNLAAVLQDGQQIVVGAPATAVAPMPVTGSAGTASSGPAAPIDLNTATLEQLESLPGVGPVLGQNILDWRAAHQQFTSIDQLGDVTGIGDIRLAQLRPLVTV